MEYIEQLWKAIYNITIADLSELPKGKQHRIAECIEQLQDELKALKGAAKRTHETH